MDSMDRGVFDSLRDKLVDLIKSDIIEKHSSSIELLHFRNFRIFSSKIEIKQQQQLHTDLLFFVLMNLVNVTGFIFEIDDIIQSTYCFVLSNTLDFISERTQNFSKLSYVKVEVNQEITQRLKHSQKKDFAQFLIGESNKLSKIQSLTKLEFIIAHQNFDYENLLKLIKNVLLTPNLNSLGIDITNNKQNTKQSIELIELISQKKQDLKELKFIDYKILSCQQDINELMNTFKNFTNLNRLQLEGQEGKELQALQYLNFLQSLPQLTQILLDLSLMHLNKDNFIIPFKQLSIYDQLEVLKLILPHKLDLKREQAQTIANFVEAQSNTLKDLHLSFQLTTFNFQPFYKTFPKLKQLERIQIAIQLKKLTIDFIIDANSENQKQTIFDLQYFDTALNYNDEICQQYSAQISALELLKLIIIQEANNIKRLEIEDMNFYNYNVQEIQLLSQLFQFNNIEELSLLNVQGTNIILKLLKNNKNSLKSLVIDLQNYQLFDNFRIDPRQENELIEEDLFSDNSLEAQTKRGEYLIFQKVLKCQNLQKLWLFQEFLGKDDLFLSKILTSIPKLSSLEITLYFYQFTQKDILAIINNGTLTRLKHNDYYCYMYHQEEQFSLEISGLKPIELITNERMAQILSIQIFHKYISSILNFNPNNCIWDLFL